MQVEPLVAIGAAPVQQVLHKWQEEDGRDGGACRIQHTCRAGTSGVGGRCLGGHSSQPDTTAALAGRERSTCLTWREVPHGVATGALELQQSRKCGHERIPCSGRSSARNRAYGRVARLSVTLRLCTAAADVPPLCPCCPLGCKSQLGFKDTMCRPRAGPASFLRPGGLQMPPASLLLAAAPSGRAAQLAVGGEQAGGPPPLCSPLVHYQSFVRASDVQRQPLEAQHG